MHDAEAVGRNATLHTKERLGIQVRVKGLRRAYGRLDYLVSPTCGGCSGLIWVNARRLTFTERGA